MTSGSSASARAQQIGKEMMIAVPLPRCRSGTMNELMLLEVIQQAWPSSR
jgi:hypothetical protein